LNIKRNQGEIHPWKIEDFFCQKHRKHCFASSHYWKPIHYVVKYEDLPVESRAMFEKGAAVLKIGAYIAKRWDCPSQGYFVGEIKDVERNVVYGKKVEKKNEDLPLVHHTSNTSYVFMVIEYWYEEKKIDSIVVTIAGKDEKAWAGNYGARFSGVFVRVDNKMSIADVGKQEG